MQPPDISEANQEEKPTQDNSIKPNWGLLKNKAIT